MSVHQPALEALGDHDYLVRFAQDEDTVVVRVHADPAVVALIADDEQRVVEATATYLIARQSADDLPDRSTSTRSQPPTTATAAAARTPCTAVTNTRCDKP